MIDKVFGGVMTQTVAELEATLERIKSVLVEYDCADADEPYSQLHERVRELAMCDRELHAELDRRKMEATYKLFTPLGVKIIVLKRELKEVDGKRTSFWVFTPHGKTQNVEERNKPIKGTHLKAATWVAAEFYNGATKIVLV